MTKIFFYDIFFNFSVGLDCVSYSQGGDVHQKPGVVNLEKAFKKAEQEYDGEAIDELMADEYARRRTRNKQICAHLKTAGTILSIVGGTTIFTN